MVSNKKIGFGVTGSFCSHNDILEPLRKLVENGNDVTCVITPMVQSTDTRFGKAEDLIDTLEKITKKKVVTSIVEAEQFGPKKPFDVFVIAPITACSLSKLAHGQTDNAVLMAAKSTLRNQHPVVLSIASNDALGISGCNIMKLMATKNIFFVPFGQDDPIKKPNSMISSLDFLDKTISHALDFKQMQPVIITYGTNH